MTGTLGASGAKRSETRLARVITSVIIAGSRSVSPSPDEIDEAIRAIDPSRLLWNPDEWEEVVCGMARGADLAGRAWALRRGLYVHEDPVTDEDYTHHGRYVAPKVRNRRMAERACAALIFWDGESGGSADMCARMVARDKPCRVIPWRKSWKSAPSGR
jgi:hypothetical protein